jgi:hypothetical protein
MNCITPEIRKQLQIANTEASKNLPENLAEIIAKTGLLSTRDS